MTAGRTTLNIRIILVLVLMTSTAQAKEHVVEMLNEHQGHMMRFSVSILNVASGDTVIWKATHKTHNVEFIDGGIPATSAPFKSPYNQDGRFTFNVPGLYVFKCNAHLGMGMLGLVIVDHNLSNLAALRTLKLPLLARDRLDELIKTLSEKGRDQPLNKKRDAPAGVTPLPGQ